MNEDDTFRGFGHIEFATVEAAEKVDFYFILLILIQF